MWSSASPRPLPTMLLVCSTPMISLMCRLPIMRWSSALARFAGMNDAQRAAQRFQVWSSVARFGCSLPLLLTISASAFKLSNCTIPRLGIICAINSKLVRNSIACNSVSAKIRLPIWRLPRTYSSRHLCRPSFFQICYRLISILDYLYEIVFAALVVLACLFHSLSLPYLAPFLNSPELSPVGKIVLDPDEAVQEAVRLVLSLF